MRVYRDPVTGVFTAPSPGTAGSTAVDARVSPSTRELVETQGTSAAGGMRLDLQGKFRSYAIGTKDEQGRISVRCETGAPSQP